MNTLIGIHKYFIISYCFMNYFLYFCRPFNTDTELICKKSTLYMFLSA